MQNVRSQPPYHINLFSKAKSKEWRNSWIASNPSAQRHKALKSTVSIAKEIKRKSNVERLVEIPIGYRNSAPHKATPKNGRTLLSLLTRLACPKRAHYIGFAFSIEKAPLQDPGIATSPFNPSWVSPCSWNPRAFSTNDASFQILWIFEHFLVKSTFCYQTIKISPMRLRRFQVSGNPKQKSFIKKERLQGHWKYRVNILSGKRDCEDQPRTSMK